MQRYCLKLCSQSEIIIEAKLKAGVSFFFPRHEKHSGQDKAIKGAVQCVKRGFIFILLNPNILLKKSVKKSINKSANTI